MSEGVSALAVNHPQAVIKSVLLG